MDSRLFASLADDDVGEARSVQGTVGGINELKCNRMMKKLGVPEGFGGRQNSEQCSGKLDDCMGGEGRNECDRFQSTSSRPALSVMEGGREERIARGRAR